MADDSALTLKEAAAEYGFTVSTLRAEHGRGRLKIYRIGKKDYTTPADIKDMVQQCRVDPRGRGFTLIRSGGSGSSETDRVSSALAAAKETAQALKRHSRNTSAISIGLTRRVRQ
jgi:hypothetical protein